MGLCSRCRIRPPREGQRYCRPCHAAYMRATRCKHSELSEENRRKANCRAYSNVLQKRRVLIPKPCRICGAAAEKHHPDYGNPRRVIWVCRDCHKNVHAHPRI